MLLPPCLSVQVVARSARPSSSASSSSPPPSSEKEDQQLASSLHHSVTLQDRAGTSEGRVTRQCVGRLPRQLGMLVVQQDPEDPGDSCLDSTFLNPGPDLYSGEEEAAGRGERRAGRRGLVVWRSCGVVVDIRKEAVRLTN